MYFVFTNKFLIPYILLFEWLHIVLAITSEPHIGRNVAKRCQTISVKFYLKAVVQC